MSVEQDHISTMLIISPGSPCPYTEDSEPCTCLTLKEFSDNASQYSYNQNTSGLILKFLPGNHILTSQITVQNISYLKMLSYYNGESAAIIQCSDHASFRFINITMAQLVHLTFNRCGKRYLIYTMINNRLIAALFNIVFSKISINECSFHHSKGTVIDARYCNISIYKCEFINSSYGVIKATQCRISDNDSFYCNTSQSRNYVWHLTSSILNCSKCKFDRNGRVFYISNTTLMLYASELTNNEAQVNNSRSDLSIFFARISIVQLNSSSIKGNTVANSTIVYLWRSSISLCNISILHNTAHLGQILYVSKVMLESYNITTIAENFGRISTANFKDSHIRIRCKFLFINNSGTLIIKNSNIQFFNTVIFQNCRGLNAISAYKTISERRGGVLKSINSNIWFFGLVLFRNNSSEDVGGALCAMHASRIFVNKSILVVNNHAKINGGGIYLYISNFICKGHCNLSENHAIEGNGGGIYAIDSKITLGNESVTQCNYKYVSTNYPFINVSLILRHNSAINGGGMYLTENSNLIIPSSNSYRLIFEHNNANKDGQAMYVDDDTYHATCCESNNLHQCFLQSSVSKDDNHDLHSGQVQVIGNSTNLKTTIFGGLFHKCYVFYYEEMGIDYLKAVTGNQDIIRMITSKAVRVYFCNGSEVMEHTQTWTETVMVQKGEHFTINIVAMDQVNRPVEATIYTHLQFLGSFFGDEQHSDYQNNITEANCSSLTFSVHSLSNNETLFISPESPCNNKKYNVNDSETLKVPINFTQCTCPIGFYIDKHNKSSCVCDCDQRIMAYQQQCNLSSVVRDKNG